MGSHLAGPRIRPGLLTTLSGLCVAGTAAGVLTARLRRRLMTADVLSRTGLTLGSVADVSELRAALASALGDETLDIHLSSVDHGPARIDDRRPDGTRRRRVEVTDGGRRVAALSFDAALAGDDGCSP